MADIVTAGLLKKWQTQSHDWSTQKVAETDTHTHTQTDRQVSPLYSSEISFLNSVILT